jgi:hypothetical protein
MAKVVTSEGLSDFIQTGKVTHIENHKPGKAEAPALEVKKDAPSTALGETKETKADDKSKAADRDFLNMGDQRNEREPKAAEPDEGLEAEDNDLPDRVRSRIGRKHAQMKAAQALADSRAEEVAELERLAETQFNERRLQEKRAEAAEARTRELEGQQPAKPAEPELKKPTIDDKHPDGAWKYRDATGNVDWDKYTDAKADYAADAKLKERDAKEAKERAEAEQAAAVARVKANADKARKAHPDFDKVMASVANTEADRVPQFVLNYIFESESGAEIAYFLAKNPEESKRIATLKPILGLAELGTLAAKLSQPPVANTGNGAAPVARERGGAPPPITPLSGSGAGSVNTDPAKMNFKELRAYERERARSKH